MGPYSGADYRNGSDIQSDNFQPQGEDAGLPPLDDTPLPRAPDGGVILPDGRIVHPSVTATVVSNEPSGSDTPDAGSTGGKVLMTMPDGTPIYAGPPGAVIHPMDTRLIAPIPRRAPDGSPLTYAIDQGTNQVLLNSGGQYTTMPAPYATPTVAQLVSDASNPFMQHAQLGPALTDFMTLSLGGTAAILTGGAAFGLATDAGLGVFGAGAVSGAVGDLTLQGANNLEYFATGGAQGKSGVNWWEVGGSAAFGGTVSKAVDLGLEAWQSYRSGASVGNTGNGAGSNIAYRALTGADVQSLANGEGLVAKAPDGTWTAAEHVANSGPGVGGAAQNSPWISTTRSLEVAQGYDSGNGIIAIDLDQVDSLQAEVWQTAPRVNGVDGLPYHRSIWAQEVTIYQTIPPKAIIGPVVPPRAPLGTGPQ